MFEHTREDGGACLLPTWFVVGASCALSFALGAVAMFVVLYWLFF